MSDNTTANGSRLLFSPTFVFFSCLSQVFFTENFSKYLSRLFSNAQCSFPIDLLLTGPIFGSRWDDFPVKTLMLFDIFGVIAMKKSMENQLKFEVLLHGYGLELKHSDAVLGEAVEIERPTGNKNGYLR